jgi:hypothetical protein
MVRLLILADEFEDFLLSFGHTVHLNSSAGKCKRPDRSVPGDL